MNSTTSVIDTSNAFYVKTFTHNYTLSANGNKLITETDFSFSIPTGYMIFAFSRFDTGSNKVALCGISPNLSNGMMRVRNMGSAISSSITASITVVFIKTEFYSGKTYFS